LNTSTILTKSELVKITAHLPGRIDEKDGFIPSDKKKLRTNLADKKKTIDINSTLRSYNYLNLNDLAYNPQKPPSAPLLKKGGAE